jgi:membrane protein implicated in regulation of membrane protease activity
MIVLLFVLLLAALAGVLGLVLKITLVIVLTALLSVTALLAIGWLAWRRQWRRFQRAGADRLGRTTIDVGRPSRDLPGSHDDRY